MGNPLPDVKVRIVNQGKVLVEADERSATIHSKESGPKEAPLAGELQVKGVTVFKEYWRKPEVTSESFTPDRWFVTGRCCFIVNTMRDDSAL